MTISEIRTYDPNAKPLYPHVQSHSERDMFGKRMVVMGETSEIPYDESPIFMEAKYWEYREALSEEGIRYLVSALSTLCGENNTSMTIALSEYEYLSLDSTGELGRLRIMP